MDQPTAGLRGQDRCEGNHRVGENRVGVLLEKGSGRKGAQPDTQEGPPAQDDDRSQGDAGRWKNRRHVTWEGCQKEGELGGDGIGQGNGKDGPGLREWDP